MQRLIRQPGWIAMVVLTVCVTLCAAERAIGEDAVTATVTEASRNLQQIHVVLGKVGQSAGTSEAARKQR